MSEPFEGTISTVPTVNNLVFGGQNLGVYDVYLTLTADGRLIPGPGLSMDEATQQAAKMLAEHYGREMERIRREP